jgi:hypothetical protein
LESPSFSRSPAASEGFVFGATRLVELRRAYEDFA